MPDAQCDKCKKTLGEICTTEKQQKTLKSLVEQRALKILNKIISISPGICHNEMDIYHECDGVLWYEPYKKTPPGIEW